MRQSGVLINEDYLRQGSPTNSTFAETVDPRFCGTDNAISATGVALAVAIPLQAGDIVANVTFCTGATAAGTPTAGFVALYSSAATPALLAQSADLGSTARAANTAYKIPMATPYTVVTAGIYYISISFTAGTIPTLRGTTTGNATMAGTLGISRAVLAQSHGSAVGAVAPATIATPTTVATIPYLAVT